MIEVPVWRETNAKRMNVLLNHPLIRPDIGDGDELVDIGKAAANPRNYLMMGESGGIMLLCIAPGIYECHTAVHPNSRGKWTMGLIASVQKYMFTATDCYEIVTRVPVGHIAALAATQACGMTREFTLPKAAVFRGEIADIHVFGMRIQDWVPRAPTLVERGRWFHQRLESEAKRLGITEQMHENDDLHNRYVGVAVEMAFAGQVAKGALTYNRFAQMTRHPVVSLVSANQIKMDIGVITFLDGDIEVTL